MKNTRKVDNLMDLVQGLSAHEQRQLAEKIMSMLSRPSSAKRSGCDELITETQGSRPDCPHCSAKASLGFVMKRGLCRGSQRYYCKSCGRYFVTATNTAFERTRKGADVWRKFIVYTIEGRSLNYCAENCGIVYQTAFTWRHKVLNAFKVHQNGVMMSGVVQMDEMLLPISYKGNRVKGKVGTKRTLLPGADNGLPRPSYQRGTDNKTRYFKDKACVFCMVEDGNKAFYASVPGTGFMQPSMLEKTVGKHVRKETATVLVDQYQVTGNYLRDNGFRHLALCGNTSTNNKEHKPEINGAFHLQNVNAMHHHLRNFLRPYCGVSTKYLENYLALFVWQKNMKAMKQEKRLSAVSVARAATQDCYITRRGLESLPAVPMCA